MRLRRTVDCPQVGITTLMPGTGGGGDGGGIATGVVIGVIGVTGATQLGCSTTGVTGGGRVLW